MAPMVLMPLALIPVSFIPLIVVPFIPFLLLFAAPSITIFLCFRATFLIPNSSTYWEMTKITETLAIAMAFYIWALIWTGG